MRPIMIVALLSFVVSGCLAGDRGMPGGTDSEPEEAEAPACGTTAGVLEGAVYYWGLPGEPDSIAADSVDIFITNGGPTFRTPTSIQGTFTLVVDEGAWTVAADDPNGCLNENAEHVVIEPCETTNVNLVIDLCDP